MLRRVIQVTQCWVSHVKHQGMHTALCFQHFYKIRSLLKLEHTHPIPSKTKHCSIYIFVTSNKLVVVEYKFKHTRI
uniref:Uncharacterized protein n=1 Tax=Physcomitrium patens TaxID=3218 RepID=A0A2K1IYM2_PHYPA|nr:hypothetical protein PHYPA_024200 [Physcomitrium patens]